MSIEKIGSGRVPGKGRIWATPRKVEIQASTREGFGRVPRNGRIRASAEKVEIQASTGKGRIRVSVGKVEIWVSTRERWNPGEYQRKVRASIGKG